MRVRRLAQHRHRETQASARGASRGPPRRPARLPRGEGAERRLRGDPLAPPPVLLHLLPEDPLRLLLLLRPAPLRRRGPLRPRAPPLPALRRRPGTRFSSSLGGRQPAGCLQGKADAHQQARKSQNGETGGSCERSARLWGLPSVPFGSALPLAPLPRGLLRLPPLLVDALCRTVRRPPDTRGARQRRNRGTSHTIGIGLPAASRGRGMFGRGVKTAQKKIRNT